MDQRVLLTRYVVLAANRRHFSLLFFGTVAFTSIFSLVLWAALTSIGLIREGSAVAAAAIALLGGAFVEHRLLQRERSAFEAMCSCWRAISSEEEAATPTRTWPGAMSIVVAAQCFIGVLGALSALW